MVEEGEKVLSIAERKAMFEAAIKANN